MYKINLYFKSNIEGVYTKEEETATDKFQLVDKKYRMIDRWFNILCPHIDIHKYKSNVLDMYRLSKKKEFDILDEMMKLQVRFIKQTLDEMDEFDELITGEDTTQETMRKFEIIIEEI